jgi:hypothetical protein
MIEEDGIFYFHQIFEIAQKIHHDFLKKNFLK